MNVPCNTCITKAICFQKDIIECDTLRNNILDIHNITKVIDKNDISYFEIILKINNNKYINIMSWNQYGKVKLITASDMFTQFDFLSITLKNYISNIQKPMVRFVAISKWIEKIDCIKDALSCSPYFKNVNIRIS
jgi:hypothetical protein